MNLTLENICKSFGAHEVLKELSFTVRGGAALGLLGRNGSGKTTTIRIIMDIFPPNSGRVTLDGGPVAPHLRKIGYLPEERGLYPKRTIGDQMAYLGELRGLTPADARRRGKVLLERMEVGEYFTRRLDTLSKGNQQKIQLAIALLNDPEIVILDEPFSGLDPVNAKMLKDIVASLVAEGRTVLFSSHQMAQVEEFCDDICLINRGAKVLDGNLRQIKQGYPRNRLLLMPADGADSPRLLAAVTASAEAAALCAGAEAAREGVLVTLHDARQRGALMTLALALGIPLDGLRVVEPTLEEIFVQYAGEEDAV